MKKFLFLLCFLLVGCSTIYNSVHNNSVSPKISLGMTKQEVIAKCGNPLQASAIQGKDGKIFELFMYQEGGGFWDMVDTTVNTYVYFVDGKVVYYGGNREMPSGITSTVQ